MNSLKNCRSGNKLSTPASAVSLSEAKLALSWQVCARSRDEGGETFGVLGRIEDEVGGAVSVGAFELVPDASVREHAEALGGERGPQQVTAQTLKTLIVLRYQRPGVTTRSR